MDKFILWAIVSYGMTTILVYGKIFNGLRDYIKYLSEIRFTFRLMNIIPKIFNFINVLINCVLCTSTWVGFFLSIVLFSPTEYYFNKNIFNIFFDGMLSAGIVWAINSFIEFFEENRLK